MYKWYHMGEFYKMILARIQTFVKLTLIILYKCFTQTEYIKQCLCFKYTQSAHMNENKLCT